MQIPEEFFESEVREGFYIPAKMKRGWAAILDVLDGIAQVCERHRLKWWMDWGSMLGIVRHGGFIPWDDDIDISMFREDYMQFIEIAPKELPERFRVLNAFNTADYFDSGSRVANNASIVLNDDFLENSRGLPYIAGVDIICIDYISPDRDEELCSQIKRIHDLAESLDEYSTVETSEKFKNIIKKIEQTHKLTFDREKPLAQQLYILMEQLMSSVKREGAKEAAMVPAHAVRPVFRAVFPIEYYDELIMLPFEFIEVPVPLHYDEMLKKIFSNYMRAYRNGGTHNYPFYADQEDLVYEQTGYMGWPVYQWEGTTTEHIANCDAEEHNDRGEKAGNVEIQGEKEMGETENFREQKDIVFLVTKAENWPFMQKEYEKAVEEGANVYVIPIPYFYRTNTMGVDTVVHYEGQQLAQFVEVTGFDRYDFYGRNPDVVYFDTPYDLYDAHLAVHPMFYTDRIREFSKKMVYVSCIMVDEYEATDLKAVKMMKFCINTPGVAKADEVIVQSENIRERYIESLTEWAGEDTKEIWEQKIKPTGLTPEEFKEYPKVTNEELTEEWLAVLAKH